MADTTKAGDCGVDGSEANATKDNGGPRVESRRVDIVTSTYTG